MDEKPGEEESTSELGGNLPLPEWFALRGPEPGWLAGNWSLILAALGACVLLLNTFVTQGVFSNDKALYGQVNEWVAWMTTLALFLQSRHKNIARIAHWRAKVREQSKVETQAGVRSAVDQQLKAARYAKQRGLCGDIGPFGHVCTRWLDHDGQHQGVRVDGIDDRIYANWGDG